MKNLVKSSSCLNLRGTGAAIGGDTGFVEPCQPCLGYVFTGEVLGPRWLRLCKKIKIVSGFRWPSG